MTLFSTSFSIFVYQYWPLTVLQIPLNPVIAHLQESTDITIIIFPAIETKAVALVHSFFISFGLTKLQASQITYKHPSHCSRSLYTVLDTSRYLWTHLESFIFI